MNKVLKERVELLRAEMKDRDFPTAPKQWDQEDQLVFMAKWLRYSPTMILNPDATLVECRKAYPD